MILEKLSEFAYFQDLRKSLVELAELATPESWRFIEPQQPTGNQDTPILERYIFYIFRNHAIRYNRTLDATERQRFIFIYGAIACFHTGLITPHFEDIYALFEKSSRKNSRREWIFRGFYPSSSPKLRGISRLPDKPTFYGNLEMYHPEWEVRIHYQHILQDNRERLPSAVRELNILPLLLKASVIYGRELAYMDPSIIVPHVYHNRIQYLMPICLTDMRFCDLAMVLDVFDGFYCGTTCLNLEMAYYHARLIGRPSASWLAGLVNQEIADVEFDYQPMYGVNSVMTTL